MTDGSTAEPGNGARRALDRLAGISAPVLLAALGVVLWSMLAGVVEGVAENHGAIIELRAAVDNLTDTVTEQTADRWTATQETQQQALQALIDAAQNQQLVDAEELLRQHQTRLEQLLVDVTLGFRRLDDLADAIQTD